MLNSCSFSSYLKFFNIHYDQKFSFFNEQGCFYLISLFIWLFLLRFLLRYTGSIIASLELSCLETYGILLSSPTRN